MGISLKPGLAKELGEPLKEMISRDYNLRIMHLASYLFRNVLWVLNTKEWQYVSSLY